MILQDALAILSGGAITLWLYYAIRIFLESNPLTDLETRYAHLQG